MTEEFLHYLWKHKILPAHLQTQNGEKINIIQTGIHNHDAGPDFLDARIKIGSTLWAGNIEIHVKSSDWFKHEHQNDHKYDNIILHFVCKNDTEIKRKNNESIPTLELGSKFDQKLYENYLDFKHSEQRIPCAKQLSYVDGFIKETFKERTGIERLEKKCLNIKTKLEQSKWNWDQTFTEDLFKNFGFRKNSMGFELLAKSIPAKIIYQTSCDLFQLEALLFGQAGFLNKKFIEEYPIKLQSEYMHLKSKFNLKQVDQYLWKFLRLRPSNFPTIRISQLAAVLFNNQRIFSETIIPGDFSRTMGLFNVKASEYWDYHYTFNKKSTQKVKKLGKTSVNLIMINTIVPYIFMYGKTKNKPDFIVHAIDYLRKLPVESNSITRQWEKTGIKINNAFDSQALIHLFEKYCNYKRCLHCTFGHNLLRRLNN